MDGLAERGGCLVKLDVVEGGLGDGSGDSRGELPSTSYLVVRGTKKGVYLEGMSVEAIYL